jgi:hypothetical protein
MQIVKNAFPVSVFQQLQCSILDDAFPWYYGRHSNINTKIKNNLFLYGWQHTVKISDEISNPGMLDIIQPAFASSLATIGQTLKDILRVRAVLNTVTDKPYIVGEHVDYEQKHMTALIYINDSDGPTIVYNERYLPLTGVGSADTIRRIQHTLTIKDKIEPVANTMVTFNGLHYHSGTTPVSTARRVVLNINYTVIE